MDRKEYKRLQFKFSIETVERLDQMVDLTDSSSRAEVARKAIRLYDYTVKMLKKGYDLEYTKDGEKITIAGTIVA
jgi:hypothetical protein